MRKCILVVAREAHRRASLAQALMAAGYHVELAEESKRARELARSGDVALALLAPEGFGTASAELARQLRDAVGELILLERAEESAQTLIERVNGTLRPTARQPAPEAEIFYFDGWRLDVPAHSLRHDEAPETALTRSEFELLLVFLRNSGRVLSRDQLRNAVAGKGTEPYERSVDMLVGRLRRKIEPDPKAPRLIITAPGAGYRFTVKPQLVSDLADARPAPAAAPTLGTDEERRGAQDQGRWPERRQVTVMSCEFVISGPQSGRLDPEDLETAIDACGRYCGETIAKFGGAVVHHIGHKSIASFGYPAAGEDDVERAVRAGLALTAMLPQVEIGTGLVGQVCVGVATGVVVAGASGAGQPEAFRGDTPRIAEALQEIAQPGQVVIAASTRRLVRGLFQYLDLAPVALKSFHEPLDASRVLAANATASRFEAWQQGGPTPLVGREEEQELLHRRWRQAAHGEGRVVLLTGEAGIGKSRMVAALSARIEAEPRTVIRYFCSPRHSDTTLFPIIAQLERAIGFERADGPAERLAKLAGFLKQSDLDEAEAASLIGHLLSLPVANRYPVQELSPQRRKEKVFSLLLAWLQRISVGAPVLLVLEDAHWIDPTSLEFLSLAVSSVARLPALLLVTARPEFAAPWSSDAHVTSLVLARLSRSEVATMVERISGNTLPGGVADEIAARADGVPLFVEELTKSVLETRVPEDREQRNAKGAVPPAWTVPSSLHDSLMARLDRLGPARTVAQVGAALGREFSHELIGAVMPMPREQLDAALYALVGAGLMFRRGAPPHAEYTFKHALVQDVAHASLLRRTRQQLHGRIAETLEKAFPDVVAAQPERLAQHHFEAGATEMAVVYRLKAGVRALMRSAMTEAVAQLRNGLDLLSSLPDSASRERLELDLQLALARTMMATQGYAALSVGGTYARARQLCLRLDHPPQFVTVLYGQFLHNFMRGELLAAQQTAEEMLRLGEAQGHAPLAVMGRRLLGVTAMAFGDFAAGSAHLEQCLAEFRPTDRPFYATLAIDDLRVNMLGYSANALLHLGHLDLARARIAEAIAEARQLSHAYSLVHALMTAYLFDWCTAEWSALSRDVGEALRLSTEHGFSLFRAWGEAFQGCALAALGRAEEGLVLLNQGLAATRAIGQILHLPQTLTMVAYAYGKVGDPEAGLKRLEEASVVAESTQDRWVQAELHRIKGELLVAMQDRRAAEASFQQAIAIGKSQGSRLFELRAAVSLAHLWLGEGRKIEARDMLAPIYNRFPLAAVPVPDLVAARQLLEGCESRTLA